MANEKNPGKPPRKKELDAVVLSRRQKDLDGFTEKYQDILDTRAVQYADRIKPVYERFAVSIQDDIAAIFRKHANPDGTLNTTGTYAMERIQALQADMLARLHALQGGQVDTLTNALAYEYTSAYYFHAFGLEQAAQVAVQVPLVTYPQVMGVLANPWLPDGKTYSDRVRLNTFFLGEKMKEAIEDATVKGSTIPQIAQRITETAGEGWHNAVRLARTEMNRAANQGANHLFIQNADIMDGKRWNATLDSKTAPKDAGNDGEIFPIEYDTPEMPGEPGKRIPNHPNCRCKWSPVLSALGVSKKERIARDAEGNRIYTKARTYEEYAKEQGLPDLNDRLAKDDPKRYLRPDDKQPTVPNPKAPVRPEQQTPPAAKPKPAAAPPKAEEAPQPGKVQFVPAASIKEATGWAKNNLPIMDADYKGFDLKLANEMNEGFANLWNRYPEIKDVNFIGTSQERNLREWRRRVDRYVEKIKPNNPGIPEERLLSFARGKVRKNPQPTPNNWASATNHTWGSEAGIAVNKAWAGDYERFAIAAKRNVETKFHPIGAETPAANVVTHEFGHSIDYFLEGKGLRGEYLPLVQEYLNKGTPWLTENLSTYAGKNDREVIAEAFAEYIHNPKPREVAQKVGKALDAALGKYRKGLTK